MYNFAMPDALTDLTGINLSDLVASFGWQNSPRLAAALHAAVFERMRELVSHPLQAGGVSVL